MTYEHGRILAVNEVTLGSELVGDTLAGALSLTVEDPVDFDEDGGQLVINGQVIEYTTYDDDTGEITLAEALAVDAEEGDAVHPYDPLYGVASVEKIAQVELDGDDYNTDPIEATIAHHLVKELGEGIRGLRGESCLLELDGDEWRIVDVLGLGSPTALGMQAEANDAYVVTAADVAAGTATMTLSHTPIDESVKGFWGVLPQEPTEYTVSGQTVTWPLGGVAKAGDRLWVHYWYRMEGATPEALPEPTIVTPAGWSGTNGAYTSQSLPSGTEIGDLILFVGATTVTNSDARLTALGNGFFVGTATTLNALQVSGNNAHAVATFHGATLVSHSIKYIESATLPIASVNPAETVALIAYSTGTFVHGAVTIGAQYTTIGSTGGTALTHAAGAWWTDTADTNASPAVSVTSTLGNPKIWALVARLA